MTYETIEGTVSAVVFHNPDNGYSVLRIDTQNGLSTAAGSVPGITPGERLKLHGSWITHPQYGQQFKIESYEMKPPSGQDEIYRYLASGAIKNIGPAKARDIVEKFGANTLSIIENEPDKLSTVKGISLRSARIIGDGYKRQAGLRRLIDYFTAYGITPLVATRLYKDYGDESIDAVQDNPYIITNDAYGADFSQADTIAIELGFESDCPERVSAAIVFELTHNTNNSGHTFIPEGKLLTATNQLIGANHEVITDALDALCECGDIVVETIAGEKACYMRQMHEAEYYTSMRIQNMAHHSIELDNISQTIDAIESAENIKYAPLQRSAIELAAKSHAMALTGGPGTGKTTTILGILKLFDSFGLKTLLCAPTGRAAKRLSEICNRDAATIHRMLGTSPGEDGTLLFEHDDDNPLDADAVIVDESSMIDILLMRSLLGAIKQGGRLIMVGDADQLPPVGPGQVFSDILKSEVIPTIALTEIFRQIEDSGIVVSSHMVNAGTMPDMTQKYPDLFFMKRTTEVELSETIAELYGERLPKYMNIPASQIQVLSPSRKQVAGTEALNNKLRESVNPKSPLKKEKQQGEHLFRVGDKIMQIRNNYDIIWKSIDGSFDGTGVFNGDVGIITDIDLDKETLTVDFEDKLVTYLFEQLPELEPAFAITVHKSQGSEYQAVILAMTDQAPQLLSRSILYTAMTRAKKLLVIVGSLEVMEKMVINDRQNKRYSGLRARLIAKGES
ncbi:MAG: ATP-dependent RecD-like DNA helicase [Oscillospiraceae bacterium]|nr:ATP-dependent RecD-like DNA helicase [Oscillospiraceae bacterium]